MRPALGSEPDGATRETKAAEGPQCLLTSWEIGPDDKEEASVVVGNDGREAPVGEPIAQMRRYLINSHVRLITCFIAGIQRDAKRSSGPKITSKQRGGGSREPPRAGW